MIATLNRVPSCYLPPNTRVYPLRLAQPRCPTAVDCGRSAHNLMFGLAKQADNPGMSHRQLHHWILLGYHPTVAAKCTGAGANLSTKLNDPIYVTRPVLPDLDQFS